MSSKGHILPPLSIDVHPLLLMAFLIYGIGGHRSFVQKTNVGLPEVAFSSKSYNKCFVLMKQKIMNIYHYMPSAIS